MSDEKINWKCWEEIGTPIYHNEEDRKDERVFYLIDGMEIYTFGAFGEKIIAKVNEQGKYATSECWLISLEFAPTHVQMNGKLEQINCWKATGFGNLKAIQKLELYGESKIES